MANQPETATYSAGIYQFETTDVVEGGVGGIDNRPLLELANRTAYLKQHVDTAEADIEIAEANISGLIAGLNNEANLRIAGNNALQVLITQINKFIPKRRFSFTGLNIGTTVGTLTSSGDVTSVQSTGASTQQTILNITIPAMPNMNYLPKIFMQYTASPYPVANHAKTFAPSVTVLSNSVFSVVFGKGDALPTNFTVKCEVVSLD